MKTWTILRWHFTVLEILALVPLLWSLGCGSSYSDDDTTANTVAARTEANQVSACSMPDAGTCSPAYVRASSTLAYCANARELSAHGKTVPAAPTGVTCPHP